MGRARADDDLPYLLCMQEAGLDELVSRVGMQPGHAMKFRAYLAAVREHQEPATSVEPAAEHARSRHGAGA